MTTKNPDFIDKLVAWGCGILHLENHTPVFQQLTKFLIVGFTNTAINWAIFALMLAILPISDEVLKSVISSAIAFSISVIFNFWASTTWVFATTNQKTKKRLFLEFAVLTGVAFLLFDEAMLASLVAVGWLPMLAKVATTACGMVFNFITRKIFLEDDNALKSRLTKSAGKKSRAKRTR